MRQLVYTIFISYNRASFHLWWKKNLIKYQKVSKYYESNCRYVYVSNGIYLIIFWCRIHQTLPKFLTFIVMVTFIVIVNDHLWLEKKMHIWIVKILKGKSWEEQHKTDITPQRYSVIFRCSAKNNRKRSFPNKCHRTEWHLARLMWSNDLFSMLKWWIYLYVFYI